MKTSMQLKMGHNLTMTPQMQQSMRLLQLSSLELQLEVQGIIDSNPMLEAEDLQLQSSDEKQLGELPPDFNEIAPKEYNKEESEWSENIPMDIPIDPKWDNVHSRTASSIYSESDPHARSCIAETLKSRLEWQLNLVPMSEQDRLIGMAIIEAVNPNGYLTCSLEDIFHTLNDEFDDLDFDEISVLQHLIQQFDPTGCASINLSQCLQVQLSQQIVPDTLKNTVHELIDKHLLALGAHDYAGIMKKMCIKEELLSKAIKLIKCLNPWPGSEIEQPESSYVIPDIIVGRDKDVWKVELNSDVLPRLRINNNYASMIQRANNSRDNVFLKNNLQEARWLLKNLQNRNETLLKVALKIVEFQEDFFVKGEKAMKPLVLADIAEAVDMHKSTISRVTTQKYMHTPKGLFELKYFFSSHVKTKDGGECSSVAIMAQIKKMVSEERKQEPLSDSRISTLLRDQGIKVARRTIAKYRESLHILTSRERKTLI